MTLASRPRCRESSASSVAREESQVIVGRRAHDDGPDGVRDPAVDPDREVHAEDVAVAQCVVVRQSVQHRVVDGQADDVAERAVAEGRGVVPVAGLRTALADPAADVVFQVEQVDAHVGELAELGQDLGDELPGGVHPLDLCGRLQLDHGRPSRATLV